jgi:exodeoxyribonuclease-1
VSFVIYDLETTGLRKGFDQILQFGAIRTNADLEEEEQFDVRCRLLPYVIPAPEAYHLTRIDIADLRDTNRPSHYEAICTIYKKLCEWSPSTFIGFNSISFDEEFLRYAFFHCLHPPYLTNTNGNTRADVLRLVRAVAATKPGLLIVPKNEDGRPSFRLAELAAANGFDIARKHEALADVEATLHLCRIVRDGAPDIWSRFLRFAQKAAVLDFIQNEEAFVSFDYIGGQHTQSIVTYLGQGTKNPNVHYCIDLRTDLDILTGLDDHAFAKRISEEKLIRRVTTNRAPLLCPLYEASTELLGELSEEEFTDRASRLRQRSDLIARLLTAARSAEIAFPNSPHLELQLYSSFIDDQDQVVMAEFHEASWEERIKISGRFMDIRLKRLARRLAYIERPDLLAASTVQTMGDEIRKRLLESDTAVPWLTIPSALTELAQLLREVPAVEHDRLNTYREFLLHW